MSKRSLPLAAAAAAFALSVPVEAHHSLARFDLTAPLWVRGTIVRFERVNPHSVLFLDQELADGRVHRWAVDGPGVPGLAAMGVDQDSLKPGDVVEVCGFTTKEGGQKRLATAEGGAVDPARPTMQGQLMNGHVLVLADGQKRLWSDYGQLGKCITDDERASLRRDWRRSAAP